MAVGPLRVLVVDDSALMRRLVTDLLEADGEIQVVGAARDGCDALEKVRSLDPAVVVLDLAMPRMSGLEFLRRLFAGTLLPVVVLTGVGDTARTLAALEEGAMDFVLKPSGPISPDIQEVGAELITKVKWAAQVNLVEALAKLRARPPGEPGAAKSLSAKEVLFPIVAIGSSTGGPQAVRLVLSGLPRGFGAPVLLVQHMPASFTRGFARRIGQLGSLSAKEAEDGDLLEPGVVYVAPGGWHMKVVPGPEGRLRVALDDGPPVNGVRPAVDVLFRSLAEVAGYRTVALILTGMGVDGAEGVRCLKEAGAATLAQDAPSSTVFGMPRAAVETGAVDHVLPIQEIPVALARLVAERQRRPLSHRSRGDVGGR